MLQGADDAEAAEAWGSSVGERIWGPVCGEHTHAIGAPAPVASVLLRPSSAAANLVKQMEALVPVELLPRSEDTQASLVARLAKSEYLHPKLVLSKGNGTGRHKYVDLNSTQYAQPRRVRWGAPMRDPWKKHSEDDNGEVSVHLPCYRHSYSRSPLESTCEVVYPKLSINLPSFCGRRQDRSSHQTLCLHRPTTGSSASTTRRSRVLWEDTGTTSKVMILCHTWQQRTHRY